MNTIAFRRSYDGNAYAMYYLVEIEPDGREQPEVSDRIYMSALQAHKLNRDIVRMLTEDDVKNAAAEEREESQ